MMRIKVLRLASLFVAMGAACSQGTPVAPGSGGAAVAGSGGAVGGGSGGAAGAARGGAPAGGSAGTAAVPGSGGAGGGSGSGPGGGSGSGAAGVSGSAGIGGGGTAVLPTLVTSSQDAYWKTDGQLTEVSSGPADVTIDDSAVAQRWDGFGGTFSERGGDQLAMLSASDRDRVLNLLFGKDGLRFTYGRIPVGASDYSLDRYSLDETPGDTSMAHFSIERDKQKLIPYVKAALGVAPGLHLWASPWSPPTWMKDNAAFDGGNMKEDDATLQAFALYLTKFVQEYGKAGIPIEVVHPQKEPNLALDFPSCVWTAPGMNKFIGAALGPMFAAQKVNAQIFLGSLSEDGHNGKARAIIDAVTADATAMSYVKGFGFEWDGLQLVAAVKSKNLPIWQNNHNVGNLPWGGGFKSSAAPNDHAYAVSSWGLIRDWIRGGVTAYFTSNMLLDSVGVGLGKTGNGGNAWPQNALLVVDATTKKLVVTPAFYLFRHLSPFVDAGASVIGTTGGDALAFKNPDGTIVAVLFNAGTPKTTTVAMAGKQLRFDLPALGWATIKIDTR